MATITAIRTSVVFVTQRTNWVFVLVDADDGRTGVGEATLDGHEDQVLAEVRAATPRFVGQPASPLSTLTRPHPGAFGGLAHAAATSAIEQALWDLLGQRLGVPVSELLGGAAVAERAGIRQRELVAALGSLARGVRGGGTSGGRRRIRCRQVRPVRRPALGARGGSARRGADRGRAGSTARGARGDRARDRPADRVPWAVQRADGRGVMPRLAALNPYWIEAPVSERDLEGWRRVRDATDARLAGGEMLVGLAAHRRFIEASGVDVIMGDVKYCGGIGALRDVAALADAYGIELAPHNPSGPVSTAATAHVAAAMPHVIPIMEFAWGEADWRSSLVGGAEAVDGGRVRVPTGARPGHRPGPRGGCRPPVPRDAGRPGPLGALNSQLRRQSGIPPNADPLVRRTSPEVAGHERCANAARNGGDERVIRRTPHDAEAGELRNQGGDVGRLRGPSIRRRKVRRPGTVANDVRGRSMGRWESGEHGIGFERRLGWEAGFVAKRRRRQRVEVVPRRERRNDDARVDHDHRRVCSSVSRTISAVERRKRRDPAPR